MTPDQARAVANTVGQQLQNEWMTTYKVIAAVPNAEREFKPDPNGRTAWELATHIASADVWFLDGVLNGKFGDPGGGQAPAADVNGVADWYKKEFPNRLERVLALPDHKLTEIIDFFAWVIETRTASPGIAPSIITTRPSASRASASPPATIFSGTWSSELT